MWVQTRNDLYSAASFISTDEDMDADCENAVASITSSDGTHASVQAVRTAASSVQFNDGTTSSDMARWPVPDARTPVNWIFGADPEMYAFAFGNLKSGLLAPGSDCR
jgi:hypothetical protein